MDNQCFRIDKAEADTVPVRAKSTKLRVPSAVTKEPFPSSLWMASRCSAVIASAKSAHRAVAEEVMVAEAAAADSNLESPNKTDPLGPVLFLLFLLYWFYILLSIFYLLCFISM